MNVCMHTVHSPFEDVYVPAYKDTSRTTSAYVTCFNGAFTGHKKYQPARAKIVRDEAERD